MRFLIFSFVSLVCTNLMAGELKPFVSDGCSGFFEGTIKENELWLPCCAEHDFAYWKGGTYLQRFEADKALQQCVIDVGEPQIASIMMAGVRVGGNPFVNTSFRWGFGWPFPRFYQQHTKEELKLIEQMKEKQNLDDKGASK